MIDVIYIILLILQLVIISYLAFGTLYIFIFSVAGLFKLREAHPLDEKIHKIAVLIPGYKEDAVILEAAEEALRQDYPSDSYDVVVIADMFKPETIVRLKSLPVKLIEVSFKESTKSKALNAGMDRLPENYYDIALVLDADNIMNHDFLSRINVAFNSTFHAVQGHRIAKNQNTSFSILDAASEEINNHIFRKGHCNLGLSSSLIGSGMAFEYDYFKAMMKNIQAVGGFDKEIELTTMREGIKIGYLEKAYIRDEKVQVSDVFIKQRRRWLSAQIHYSKYFVGSLGYLIRKGNIDFFDKALQMLLPPRILSLGTLFLFSAISFFVNPLVLTIIWLSLLLLCILAILFAVPKNMVNTKTLAAIMSLPKGYFLMLISLFSTKGANKRFIHTEHSDIRTNNNQK